jgi:hypothetical protein
MRNLLRMFGLLAALAVAGPATADDKPVQKVLSWVPADPAIFIHVDVKTTWAVMQTPAAKKADSQGYEKQTAEYAAALGIAPETVDTFTLFLPKLKGPGDEQAVCAVVTFNKPYDPKKLIAGLHELADKDKLPASFKSDKLKETKPGVYATSDKTTFDMTDPRRFVILGNRGADLAKPSGVKPSPMMAEVFMATKSNNQVVNLNWANLPDELRQQVGQSPQAEPFKPLLEAESILITSNMTAEKSTMDIRVTCETKAKALEAEKSLGVVKTLGQLALSGMIQEADKKKDESQAKLVQSLRSVQEVLKTVKIGSDDRRATASMTMNADLDLGSIMAGLIGSPRAAAARSRTQNNLKQLAIGMHSYADANTQFPFPVSVGKKGKRLHSWRVALLPYVEQDQLFKQLKMDEPWDSEHNKAIFEKTPMPTVFAVEGVTKPGDKTTHMQVFRGNGAMFDVLTPTKFANITDGTSNTVLIALAKKPVLWYQPDDLEFDPTKNPKEGLLFIEGLTTMALGDGSVRAIQDTVPEATFKALITKSGGEVVDLP